MQKAFITSCSAVIICLLAACAPKPAPPPPPPPAPPPVVYIPPRPAPPWGSAAGLAVPPLGADGVRITLNTGISPAQTVWNLRSAYNVAALNCLRPDHGDILVGYKKLLNEHQKALAAANRKVDSEYQKRFGSDWIRNRESYMTQVYNYYAYPATIPKFCEAALAMAREPMPSRSADLPSFAQRNLARLDVVFHEFYRAYEQYQADVAAWDAQYAPAPVPAAVALPETDARAAPAGAAE